MNSSSRAIDVANAAAVLVTAESPFAKPGQRLDVNVSTIGKAESLRGGNLIMTRLFGVDGEVYALAQGPPTCGIDAEAAGSSSSLRAHGGTYPRGALVERAVETPWLCGQRGPERRDPRFFDRGGDRGGYQPAIWAARRVPSWSLHCGSGTPRSRSARVLHGDGGGSGSNARRSARAGCR